jgi:hypothetical protein
MLADGFPDDGLPGSVSTVLRGRNVLTTFAAAHAARPDTAKPFGSVTAGSRSPRARRQLIARMIVTM